MQIVPKTSFLKSIRGERVSHEALLGEAIDNSFDASARNVEIKIDEAESRITISDDGVGIAKSRFESLFSLGLHEPLTSTALGRYGIGIKTQAINCADFIRVESIHSGRRHFAEVDWRKVVRSGKWEIDDPTWLPVEAGSASGTTLTLAHLRKWRPYTIETLTEQIATRFYPAIAEGRSIKINGTIIPVPLEPKMIDVVEQDIELSGGRSIKLRAGILAAPSRLNKVHVAFEHRVIMPWSNTGCGDYAGANRLFARVRLIGGSLWRLGRFKDQLTDEDQIIELELAVSEALRPLLEKCGAEAMEAKVEAIAAKVNDMLPAEMGTARPHHKKERSSGTSDKKRNKQGFVDDNKSSANGPARSRKSQKDRLLILFQDGAERDGIGAYESGSIARPHRVVFSKDHPHIRRLIDCRDQSLAAEALLREALMIYDQGRRTVDRQYDMQFEHFGRRISDLLEINRGRVVSTDAVA